MSSRTKRPAAKRAEPKPSTPLLGTFKTTASRSKVLIPREIRGHFGTEVGLRLNETGTGFYVMPWETAEQALTRLSAERPGASLDALAEFREGKLRMAKARIDDRGRLVLPPEFQPRPRLSDSVFIEGLWDRAEVIVEHEYQRRVEALIPTHLR